MGTETQARLRAVCKDLVSKGIAKPVRDEAGNLVGCSFTAEIDSGVMAGLRETTDVETEEERIENARRIQEARRRFMQEHGVPIEWWPLRAPASV